MQSSRIPFVSVVVLVLLLTSGCGSALVCPSRGGSRWLEVTSAHFVLATNRTPSQASSSLLQFELAYQVLHQLAFQSPQKVVPSRLHVALFRSRKEYQALGRPHTAGEFVSDVNGMDDEPRIALFGDVINNTQSVFLHELTHSFLSHYAPNAPLWLHEGMAVFYETLRIQDGTVVFGMPNPRLLATVLQRRIPLTRLLAAGSAAFAEDPTRYYGSAWLLFHMLRSGSRYDTESLDSYVSRMASGQSPSSAWLAAFGAVPIAQLERAYSDYLLATPWHSQSESFQPATASVSSSRWLSDGEIHILWAQLRSPHTDPERTLQRQDLITALQHEPQSAEVRYAMAQLVLKTDRKQAEQLLGEALARRAGDARYLLLLLQLRIEDLKESSSDKRGVLRAECERLMARLQPQAHSASVLRTLQSYQLLIGQLQRGLLP